MASTSEIRDTSGDGSKDSWKKEEEGFRVCGLIL